MIIGALFWKTAARQTVLGWWPNRSAPQQHHPRGPWCSISPTGAGSTRQAHAIKGKYKEPHLTLSPSPLPSPQGEGVRLALQDLHNTLLYLPQHRASSRSFGFLLTVRHFHPLQEVAGS